MPEGPETKACADFLNNDIANLTISKYTLHTGLKNDYLPNGPKNINLIENTIITKIYSRGKKIIFSLLLPQGSQIYLVSALKMTGKWLYNPGKYSVISLEIVELKNNTYIPKKILYFDDLRKFGDLIVCTSEQELTSLLDEKVGPDFLEDIITFDQYKKELKKCRRQIGVFMLDQEKFSGVGNYLRAEILYMAKINPFRICNTLTDMEIILLLYHTKDRIKICYKAKGLTFSDFLLPDSSQGQYEPFIYNKKICPKGYNIKTDSTSDKRTIHWVPDIQK